MLLRVDSDAPALWSIVGDRNQCDGATQGPSIALKKRLIFRSGYIGNDDIAAVHGTATSRVCTGGYIQLPGVVRLVWAAAAPPGATGNEVYAARQGYKSAADVEGNALVGVATNGRWCTAPETRAMWATSLPPYGEIIVVDKVARVADG